MQVLSSEGGRSVMKSTPRCDQGRFGTGSGWSLPDGRWQGLLEIAQAEHPRTNLRTSERAIRSGLLTTRGLHWPLGGQCPMMCGLNE